MNRKIRIVLVDDHPVVLGGLRNVIVAETDLEVVGEAATGGAALKLIKDKQPDIAVIDISMPEYNGVVLARRLAEECPSVRVLVLTFYEDQSYVRQTLEHGARGFLLKRSAAENLIVAIRAVLLGGLYIDPGVADRICVGNARAGAKSSPDKAALSLSAREAEVLKLVALGHSNKEIAGELDISAKSVETYRMRGTDKLGLKTRADIVRYAAGQGWLLGC
jgi:DNA-binding NarL/FixJ family response regulator